MSREDRDVEQQVVAGLVRSALAGDQDAFRQLVERKRNLVFRVALNQLGKPEEARIVAQGVFVRVWRNLHRYDARRSFDTWLYQVTVNAAIDHHRRQKARPQEVLLDESQAAQAPASDPLEAAELRRILNEVAGALGEKQRMAFVLREIEGLPTKEVAEALGTTESTVRNHVFQARKILREQLVSRYPEYARHLAGRGDEAAS